MTPVWPQLPLDLSRPPQARFDNYRGGHNAAVLAQLRQLVDGAQAGVAFLLGPTGSGRSHLLVAACDAADRAGHSAIYLPLQELASGEPDILHGLDAFDLVAIDDLDVVAGRRPWEERLFHLFNDIGRAGGQLLVAAQRPVAALELVLPDLRSRLAGALLLPLQLPADDDRAVILAAMAQDRGLTLAPEVVNYLLNHAPRDLPSLAELIDRLDAASLASGRRPGISLVRDLIGQGSLP